MKKLYDSQGSGNGKRNCVDLPVVSDMVFGSVDNLGCVSMHSN